MMFPSGLGKKGAVAPFSKVGWLAEDGDSVGEEFGVAFVDGAKGEADWAGADGDSGFRSISISNLRCLRDGLVEAGKDV